MKSERYCANAPGTTLAAVAAAALATVVVTAPRHPQRVLVHRAVRLR